MANKSGTRLLYILTKPETLRFLRGQAAYMRERGFDVHVITSPGSELLEFGKSQGVAVDAVEMTRSISPVRDLTSLLAVLKRIRKLRPQIIHASTPKAALLGILAARVVRVPVKVFLLRNLQLSTTNPSKKPVVRWSYQLTASLSDQVLAVSPSLLDLAAAEGICDRDRIRVLRGGSSNGVDAIERFNPDRVDPTQVSQIRSDIGIPANSLVIGFVGRLGTIKGLVELAAAWEQLKRQRDDLRLLMLGTFDDNHPLPPEVRLKLEADPTVHFAGQVADPAPYYSMMDVAVLPSYREGLPNALLEAAAMELPIVTTDALGCVDAIEEGVTGKLIPLKDAKALARAIAEYCEDAPMRRRHGQSGRKRVLADFQQQPIWEANYQEFVRLLRLKGIEVPQVEASDQDAADPVTSTDVHHEVFG